MTCEENLSKTNRDRTLTQHVSTVEPDSAEYGNVSGRDLPEKSTYLYSSGDETEKVAATHEGPQPADKPREHGVYCIEEHSAKCIVTSKTSRTTVADDKRHERTESVRGHLSLLHNDRHRRPGGTQGPSPPSRTTCVK